MMSSSSELVARDSLLFSARSLAAVRLDVELATLSSLALFALERRLDVERFALEPETASGVIWLSALEPERALMLTWLDTFDAFWWAWSTVMGGEVEPTVASTLA